MFAFEREFKKEFHASEAWDLAMLNEVFMFHDVETAPALKQFTVLIALHHGSDEVLVVDCHHKLAQFPLDMLKVKGIAEDRVVGLLFNLALELLVIYRRRCAPWR